MHKPKEIGGWDVPDRIQVPDGYDMMSIPDLTRDNFNYLVNEYNNLVEVVNMILDQMKPFGQDELNSEGKC